MYSQGRIVSYWFESHRLELGEKPIGRWKDLFHLSELMNVFPTTGFNHVTLLSAVDEDILIIYLNQLDLYDSVRGNDRLFSEGYKNGGIITAGWFQRFGDQMEQFDIKLI